MSFLLISWHKVGNPDVRQKKGFLVSDPSWCSTFVTTDSHTYYRAKIMRHPATLCTNSIHCIICLLYNLSIKLYLLFDEAMTKRLADANHAVGVTEEAKEAEKR